jgi:hypothetical protein
VPEAGPPVKTAPRLVDIDSDRIEGCRMKHVGGVLIVSALVVLGASAAVAIAIHPECPSGWHDLGTSWCVTDATHLAPSSGIAIPNETMPRPSRASTRIDVIILGVLIATTLLWFGLSGGIHRDKQEAATAGDQRSA